MKIETKPFEVKVIYDACKSLGLEVFEGKVEISTVDNFASVNSNELTSKSISYLSKIRSLELPVDKIRGLLLISKDLLSEDFISKLPCSYLVVDDPKYLFAFLYQLSSIDIPKQSTFKPISESKITRNGSMHISSDARFGDNVVLGDGAKIEGGVYIYENTVIGDNVQISPNTVIGGEGFGFAVRLGKPPIRIPHLGGVVIGSNVEIGANVNIDRGTFGLTEIGNDVKIDFGVHIAHNVKIGSRTLLIAKSEISGSVEIGCDVWVAPNVSIKEKVKVGDRALIGMGSVVTKDVEAGATVMGVPARVLRVGR